jgi:sugar phosphate isomerase/epimerase
MIMIRRSFIKKSLLGIPALTALPSITFAEKPLKIGLAQWSLHRALRSKKLNNLDFAKTAKEKFDIDVVEYVNVFFSDKAKNKEYLNEMKLRSVDIGVKNSLIMVDGEGNLGDLNERKRIKAVDNHKKWVEAANYIGCNHIRVNAAGNGTEEEVSKYASDSLQKLGDFSKDFDINIIVENHGGYSSDAQWLVNVIEKTDRNNVGTLPDFGNFCVKSRPNKLSSWGGLSGCAIEYDKYKGVKEMLPYAKSVSAKSINFDDNGNSIEIDFYKMMKIVKDSDYNDFVSIEYEGTSHSEEEGIMLTKSLMLEAWNKA